MQIIYSQHIKNRLSLRKIDYDLPRIIYEQSGERYFDVETGHLIALMKIKLYNKKREVMVAYLKEGENIKLLTIHPLKEGQKKTELTQVDGGDVMKDFKEFSLKEITSQIILIRHQALKYSPKETRQRSKEV